MKEYWVLRCKSGRFLREEDGVMGTVALIHECSRAEAKVHRRYVDAVRALAGSLPTWPDTKIIHVRVKPKGRVWWVIRSPKDGAHWLRKGTGYWIIGPTSMAMAQFDSLDLARKVAAAEEKVTELRALAKEMRHHLDCFTDHDRMPNDICVVCNLIQRSTALLDAPAKDGENGSK